MTSSPGPAAPSIPPVPHWRPLSWAQTQKGRQGSKSWNLGDLFPSLPLDTSRLYATTWHQSTSIRDLVSSGKAIQGCCGKMLCHRVPLLGVGIQPGKGKVSPSSPQKHLMAGGDGQSKASPLPEHPDPFSLPWGFSRGGSGFSTHRVIIRHSETQGSSSTFLAAGRAGSHKGLGWSFRAGAKCS